MTWKEDPITKKQMGMLEFLGLHVDYSKVTKGKASELITEISDKNNPFHEQLIKIRNFGDLDSHPLDVESCNKFIEKLELKFISNKIKNMGYDQTIPTDILGAKKLLHTLQREDNSHVSLYEFNKEKYDDYKF
mgnify:CR=1 FL=1